MSSVTRNAHVGLGVLVAVFTSLPLLWGKAMIGGAMGPWMMGGWNGSFGWAGGVGVISMVLFWTLLIGGVVVLVKWDADSGPAVHGRPRSEESAVEILKSRYASGEVTKAEFEQARKDLA